MPADRRHAARLQGVLINSARVAAVSDAATVSDEIVATVTDTVSGDLIAASPTLSLKFQQLNDRVAALEV